MHYVYMENGNFHVFAANPKQKLVFTGEQTINGNRLFAASSNVPTYAYTVGVVCITNAKSITNEDFAAIFTV